MDGDPRIDELQILLAHQARTIEELSDEVRRQGLAIDRLEAALRQIVDNIQQLDAQPDSTRPPHY